MYDGSEEFWVVTKETGKRQESHTYEEIHEQRMKARLLLQWSALGVRTHVISFGVGLHASLLRQNRNQHFSWVTSSRVCSLWMPGSLGKRRRKVKLVPTQKAISLGRLGEGLINHCYRKTYLSNISHYKIKNVSFNIYFGILFLFPSRRKTDSNASWTASCRKVESCAPLPKISKPTILEMTEQPSTCPKYVLVPPSFELYNHRTQ